MDVHWSVRVSISAFLYACVFPATEALNVMCASVCVCVCVCVCACVCGN